MATKTFNVDQLRIGDRLLTGSAQGLFYDGAQLAQGTSAVPNSRVLTLGKGLRFQGTITDSINNAVVDPDSADLSGDRTFNVIVDESTLTVSNADAIEIKTVGVRENHINESIAGSGLHKVTTSKLNVKLTNGLEIVSSNNSVGIKTDGVIHSMLLEGIPDSKLADITGVNKVHGTAIQLHGTSLIGSANGLKIRDLGVGAEHLQASIAGNGLAGGEGSPLSVNVGGNGGLFIENDIVKIATSGVVNSMLYGEIHENKLLTITGANKVHGSAVQLASEGGLQNLITNGVNIGLQIKDDAIGKEEFRAESVAGKGLYGNVGGALDGTLDVLTDAGLEVNAVSNKVGIKNGGILNVMISDAVDGSSISGIAATKLQGGIPLNKTLIDIGSGLLVNGNSIHVGTVDQGGIVTLDDAVIVSTDVVRTLPTVTQTLAGTYSFSKVVQFNSGIVVEGDLQVRGQTLVTVGNEVNIGDNIIVLNADFGGSVPETGGIEINRGPSHRKARLIFDDDTGDVWKLGLVEADGSNGAGMAEIITRPRVVSTSPSPTYRGAFSMSRAINAGVTKMSYLFRNILVGVPTDFAFESAPIVVVSIQNISTGFNNPLIDSRTNNLGDMVGCMVTAVNTTGFEVDFTTDIPGTPAQVAAQSASEYFLNAYISTVT